MSRSFTFAVLVIIGGASMVSAQEPQQPPEQAQQPPPAYAQQQPPPGYGQPSPTYGQPAYGQPAYGQPGYAPMYAPPPQRLRRYRDPYVEGMALPPDARVYSRPRIGLLIPGAALFGVFYLGTVMAWAISQDHSRTVQNVVLVPALGPFLAIPNAANSGRRIGLVWTGLLQVAGLALFIAGAIPKRYVEYYAGHTPGWRVSPVFGEGGGGLSAERRF